MSTAVLAMLFGSNLTRGEHRLEVVAGIAPLDLGNLFRRAGRDHLPAAIAAFWSNVDDMVRGLDDIEVVFNDDHSIALIHQLVQHL